MISLLSTSHDKLRIHYQDELLAIVEKPAGQYIHPPEGLRGYPSTLTILRDQIGQYVYPLNRLDRPVSGLCVFALDKTTAHFLKERWNSYEVVKKYILLCRRTTPEYGHFNFPLKKPNNTYQEAMTAFQLISTCSWQDEMFSLVEASIHTGRRHQIRRHFSRRCFNLVGDTKYGKGKTNNLFREHFHLDRIFLHSFFLKLPHPKNNSYIICESELPSALSEIKNQLFEKI